MAIGTSRLEPVIAMFKSLNENVRREAREKLDETSKSGFTVEEGLRLIDAALDDYPSGPIWNASDIMLGALVKSPSRPEYTPALLRNFPRYRKEARSYAFALLAETDMADAIQGVLRLLRECGLETDFRVFPRTENALGNSKLAGNIFFPDLIGAPLTEDLRYSVRRILYFQLARGVIPRERIASSNGVLLAELGESLARVRPMQRESGVAWKYEESYEQPRAAAALMIDIVAYLDDPEIPSILRDCLALPDPKFKYIAASHLLARGESVPEGAIASIAADAEMRGHLHERLVLFDKLGLMPERFRTRESLAEATMVWWLIYPTELARAPDEIELMKTLTNPDGTAAVYVFRFRTHPPHWAAEKGWMAGIAGPFDLTKPPDWTGGGDTFSAFEPWNDADPGVNVRKITSILDNWRAHHFGRSAD